MPVILQDEEYLEALRALRATGRGDLAGKLVERHDAMTCDAYHDALRKHAERAHGSTAISFDDRVMFSPVPEEGGIHVSAWVWIYFEEFSGATFRVDDEDEYTFAEMAEANRPEDSDTIEQLLGMSVGQTITIGGGAAATSTIKRLS